MTHQLEMNDFTIRGRVAGEISDGCIIGIVREVAYDPQQGWVLLVERPNGELRDRAMRSVRLLPVETEVPEREEDEDESRLS